MAYANAKQISKSAIPVIDLVNLRDDDFSKQQAIAQQFLHAAETSGFFYVANHGVPAGLIKKIFNVSLDFFQHATEEKNQVKVTDKHRGFLSVGEARMEGSDTIDLKESFIWGREYSADALTNLANNELIGRNIWPDYVPKISETFNDYFEECISLGKAILRIFAIALEVNPEYFSGKFDYTVTRASSIYYPPQSIDMGDTQFGVAPHTDYGCLTLLYQDNTGGLQVMGKEGEWLTAHPIEDTFVVNVGDLLARWTNNRFVSTPHRVVNSSGRARQSIAVFIDPDFETEIVPVLRQGEEPQYKTTTCGKYVLSRFDKSFNYRK